MRYGKQHAIISPSLLILKRSADKVALQETGYQLLWSYLKEVIFTSLSNKNVTLD